MRKPKLTTYDKAYFDRWYRSPRHRVITPAKTRRKVALAVATAEYYLERPIRSALDVGCGEGNWRSALKALRPALRYTGVDSSPYVVSRFGRARNILSGSLGGLPHLADSYDLVICSDALHYIADDEIEAGLAMLVPRLAGIAFLEAYTDREGLRGDTDGIYLRSEARYRELFRRAGLEACGSHCYVGTLLRGSVMRMERLPG